MLLCPPAVVDDNFSCFSHYVEDQVIQCRPIKRGRVNRGKTRPPSGTLCIVEKCRTLLRNSVRTMTYGFDSSRLVTVRKKR